MLVTPLVHIVVAAMAAMAAAAVAVVAKEAAGARGGVGGGGGEVMMQEVCEGGCSPRAEMGPAQRL